ncbi:MAG: hypothetical protein JJU24_08485 [Natronohydrobacter sp.]|nr:hypothetical protein [Natronohydrobacter sp.]
MSAVQDMRRARHALIWQAAVRLGEFTYHSLAGEAEVSRSGVQALVTGWLRQGVVIEARRERNGLIMFRVVAGETTPASLRPDGRARREETIQGNCWTAMRRLPQFTPTDIAAHANTATCPVSVSEAQAYCQCLVRAAYLKVIRKAQPGRREAVYRLIRNTGPMPPRERRVRAIYDDNLCEFTHLGGL